MRLPIRYKIILPFAVLLVFVGVIGSGVATARLADAAAAKFDADLLHDGRRCRAVHPGGLRALVTPHPIPGD